MSGERQFPSVRQSRAVLSGCDGSDGDSRYLYPPELEGADWEGLVSIWSDVHERMETHLWVLGEIAASVDRKYGTSAIPKFASEVGYSARRIYEMAQTYVSFAGRNMRPSQILSFTHHTVAARSEDPQRLLARAEDDQLSVREVKEIVQQEKQETVEEEFGKPERIEVDHCPSCGAPDTAWERRPE